LGAAVVAIVLAAYAAGAGASHAAHVTGIVNATHVALWLGAACACVAMLVSALRLRKVEA
jgi:hypothetical protein